uniref:Ubiquitin associated protein 1 like n=1 Tax=Erpetoichthys calabaricus TaxID=27687 RepID=A0A8C4TKX5_ERPCA
GVPGGNPHRHGENMQTPHREEPGSKLRGTALPTLPPCHLVYRYDCLNTNLFGFICNLIILFSLQSFSSYSCLPPPPSMCHSACPFISRSDTSADLLLALSKEEQDLLKPVLELGYPMSRAIRALQKIGRQSSAQILSYLMVCDRFCKQGYEESLVEEALEMFQYCEIKVDEFLHLVTEFTEMGFPLNAVKEVLLVHENHKEKALEELVSQIE